MKFIPLIKSTLILFVFICTSFYGMCQTDSSYILSGTIVNGETNTPLNGAHLLTSKKIGTKTTKNGLFNINVFTNDTLKISFIGFKTLTYIAPQKKPEKYLTKFKLYKDSIILDEIKVFPYPTYKEFKKAFLAMDKQKEKVRMEGVNMYIDESNEPMKPTIFNPASFIYDRLFDKQAKMRRRLERRRNTIKKAREGEK